jgi:branched-chain amino acid aminotransferase
LSYLNFNGKILPAETAGWPLNRALHYGDGLFETMRLHNGELLFFDDHLDRLFRGMQALKLEVPENFSPFFIHKHLVDLLGRNSAAANARVKIGVFRTSGGFYQPGSNSAEYFIEVQSLPTGYQWSEAPFGIGVYPDIRKNFSSVSFFKSMSALPYVMASLHAKDMGWDDSILLNSRGQLTEATSSNIFWVKDGTVFSLPTGEGGIDGIMRKNLFRFLADGEIAYLEKSGSPEELKTADEIFLTNVARGIQPVTHYAGKKFETQVTRRIFEWLLKKISGQ